MNGSGFRSGLTNFSPVLNWTWHSSGQNQNYAFNKNVN